MSIDINKYRNPNETEKEWQLKKLFIEKYHKRFDESRLLCLAQCYVNVETLGCRYPYLLMKELRELTAELNPIAKERLESLDLSLKNAAANKSSFEKIKFVKASANLETKPQNLQDNIKQQQQEHHQKIQILSKNFTNLNTGSVELAQPPVASASTNPGAHLLSLLTNTTKPQHQQQSNPLTALLAPPTPPKSQHTSLVLPPQPVPPSTSGVSLLELIKGGNKTSFGVKTSTQATIKQFLPITVKPPVAAAVIASSPPANQTKTSTKSGSTPARNALLKFLETGSPLPPPSQQQQQQPKQDSSSMPGEKLLRIEKLRSFLRTDNAKKPRNFYQFSAFCTQNKTPETPSGSGSVDLANYLSNVCKQNDGLQLHYVQYKRHSDSSFYGELFLGSIRVMTAQDTHKKKSMWLAYRRALDLLCDERVTLALRTVADKDKCTNNPTEFRLLGNPNNVEIPYEHELYSVDNDCGGSGDNSTQAESTSKTNSDDDVNISQCKLDQKQLITSQIVDFCLFIPANLSANNSQHAPKDQNIPAVSSKFDMNSLLNEKNAISILNNSCLKSRCKLEFRELIQNNDANEEDDEKNVFNNHENVGKHKCICYINGIKIVSASAKNKIDAKRNVSLKAINYLKQFFPIIKESNYSELKAEHPLTKQRKVDNAQSSKHPLSDDSLSSVSATDASVGTSRYFKISKEDLFGGIINPANLFNDARNNNSNNTANNQQNETNLGSKLLKKMGWKGEGHGLGARNQGISECIDFQFYYNRQGLGCPFKDELLDEDVMDTSDTVIASKPISQQGQSSETSASSSKKSSNFCTRSLKDIISNVRNLLSAYMNSSTDKDLVFDKKLSTEDRALIHKEAQRMSLKTRSQGTGSNRFLVVSKKLSSKEIYDSILNRGTSKYDILDY